MVTGIVPISPQEGQFSLLYSRCAKTKAKTQHGIEAQFQLLLNVLCRAPFSVYAF